MDTRRLAVGRRWIRRKLYRAHREMTQALGENFPVFPHKAFHPRLVKVTDR